MSGNGLLQADRDEPALFDFRCFDRLTPEQMSAARERQVRFAQTLETCLSAYLRAQTTASLAEIEERTFAEFQSGLACPTCVASLFVMPYKSRAVIEITPALIFSILEIMLGGPGNAVPPLERQITDMEQGILDDIFALMLEKLRECWRGVDFAATKWERTPETLQVAAPSDPVVCTRIEIRIEDGSGWLNLAIPASVIRLICGQSGSEEATKKTLNPEEDEQANILRLLASATLELEALLEGPSLIVGNLLALQEGNVLTFDQRTDEPLSCHVNGRRKFSGRLAASAGRSVFIIGE